MWKVRVALGAYDGRQLHSHAVARPMAFIPDRAAARGRGRCALGWAPRAAGVAGQVEGDQDVAPAAKGPLGVLSPLTGAGRGRFPGNQRNVGCL